MNQSERAELVADIAEAIKAANAPTLTYAQKRAAEYPPMSDYLDGIAKYPKA